MADIKKQVFISYKHDTLGVYFLKDLTRELQNSGFEVWSDRLIEVGDKWRESIDTGIKESFVIIVVLTPEATFSQYITYEWSYAMGLGIPIIPLVLVQLEPNAEMHPKLEPLQYLNFTEGRQPYLELMQRLNSYHNDYTQTNQLPIAPVRPIYSFLKQLFDIHVGAKVKTPEILEVLYNNHALSLEEYKELMNLDSRITE
jgi:hypothetical protein